MNGLTSIYLSIYLQKDRQITAMGLKPLTYSVLIVNGSSIEYTHSVLTRCRNPHSLQYTYLARQTTASKYCSLKKSKIPDEGVRAKERMNQRQR